MQGYKQKKILLTVPSLQDQGGVANFYNSILPHLSNGKYIASILEIGSTKGKNNPLYLFTDQLRVHSFLVRHRPNLVHINPSLDFKSFFRDGLFVYQAKRKRLPVIVFFRGWDKSFEPIIFNRLLWFFKRTYGQADTFIVLATEFKRTLQQWGIAQPIHLGSTTVEESLLERFSFEEKLKCIRQMKTIRILFLARLERGKGAFETVDAVSILVKKGLPVSLSIAGDGSIINELRKYVRDKELPEKSICFLGYVRNSDKITAFNDHHIYCLPSYSEGLPNSVLEAMAFGMPVITRPVGGLADMFQDGKMGFFCQGKTPAEIADAFEKLITNRSLMLQMSEYNHTFAKKHFMASVVAENLSEIYKTTLASQSM